MYEIQSKSDFQVGATLVVRIPEEDVDKKALYTIQSEQPDFVLPFRYRAVNGQVEFTYRVGNRSKLTYLSGSRSPKEYADLWAGLLQPLLDCGDWFMNPYSFVLESEHLYCDKNSSAISFVYIPSLQAGSDYDALKNMVTVVTRNNPVSDVDLENKVLWAIQDFNPHNFLQMLKPYRGNAVAEKAVPAQTTPVAQGTGVAEKVSSIRGGMKAVTEKKAEVVKSVTPIEEQPKIPEVGEFDSGGIEIRIAADGKKGEKAKKVKEAKPKPELKEKFSFFSKKKQQQEIIGGAAISPLPEQKKGVHEVVENAPSFVTEEVDDSATELEVYETDGPKFRYIGVGTHPKIIEVDIALGGVFTIGRFDPSVGTQQSCFEFDKRTKAVSRRHAAVERNGNGYILVDLDSSAGTFINGQKMPPNTPSPLFRGCRISFGHSGADYMWEE